MTDDRPITDDELAARIAVALRRHADAGPAVVPPAASIPAAARRQDRVRRARIAAAVAAAAVVLLTLVVTRPGADDAAYVGTGPDAAETIPEPLHLALDPALRLVSATSDAPALAERPARTTSGRYTDVEVVIYAVPGSLDPPRAVLAVATTDHPADPIDGGVGDATTIAGRAGWVHNSPSGRSIELSWDDHHQVALTLQGVEDDTAATALATLGTGADGHWSLSEPPSGLEEIARGNPELQFPGWYSDMVVYQEPASGTIHRLTVTRVGDDVRDDDVLVWALQTGAGAGATVERTTVRGHPALVVASSPEAPLRGFSYAWLEPEHQVLVHVQLGATDRARADELLASLQEVDPEEWAATLRRCTAATPGTTDPSAANRLGGSCPD